MHQEIAKWEIIIWRQFLCIFLIKSGGARGGSSGWPRGLKFFLVSYMTYSNGKMHRANSNLKMLTFWTPLADVSGNAAPDVDCFFCVVDAGELLKKSLQIHHENTGNLDLLYIHSQSNSKVKNANEVYSFFGKKWFSDYWKNVKVHLHFSPFWWGLHIKLIGASYCWRNSE